MYLNVIFTLNKTSYKYEKQTALSILCCSIHSTAQHSTAQHSTAQHSTAQHSTAQHNAFAYANNLVLVIMAIFLFNFNGVYAQNIYCDTDESQGQQNSLPTDCFIYNNYITDDTHLDHTPILYINVNLHFISLTNDPNNDYTNFTVTGASNPAGVTALEYGQALISACNTLLSNNPLLTGTYATGILPEPVQIRLKLHSTNGNDADAVHCHSTNIQSLYNYSPTTSQQTLLKNTFTVYGNDVIDIFFVRDPSNPNQWGGVGPMQTNAISITNAYNLFLNGIGVDVIKGIVLHELGHVFNLQHSWYATNNCGPFAATGGWQSSGSNNVMAYNYQSNWENCQIGIARMYLINNLKTWINKDHLCTYDPSATITIASGENILWNATRYLQGDVIVKDGATLTIKCKVGMTEGARFVVEPNGKLIIDSGWLTSVCDDKSWYGIEVLGKFNRTQYTLSNGYRHQGYLEIKNGAIIEHAQNAVVLWDSYNQNIYKTGGIVKASNSEFKNNRRSLEFMKYQNFDFNGNPKPNLSSFTNCTFTVDDEMRSDNTFYAHVTMWNVDGIKFTTCKFTNQQTDITSQQELGYGIYSLDAGFSVLGKCNASVQAYQPCPDADIDYSEFENLYMGINASNAATANFFTVNLCKFNKNFRGIQASSVNRFVAINSKFFIGNNPVNGNPGAGNAHQVGIYAIKCSGYSIENNLFEQPQTTPMGLSDGVIIYQSGAAPNEVYRNTFNRLNNMGILGIGNNFNSNPDNKDGLQFLCNTFQNQVQQNIAYTHLNPLDFSALPNSGIRTEQGASNLSAGNCFNAPNSNQVGHFSRSSSTNLIRYYFDQPAPNCKEPIKTSSGIQTIQIIDINSCVIKKPQIYFPMFSSTEELNNEKTKFNSSMNEYMTAKQTYLLLIDGGQTQQLRNEVFNAVPSQAWQLYNELNQHSPNLSTTIALYAISREDVLPNSMIFDLLYNNPDVLTDEHIYRALDLRNTPMPEYLVELLRERSDIRTLRSELADQISYHFSNATESLNTLVNHYLSDTTHTTLTDSLVSAYLLSGKHTLSVADAVRYQLQRGNITEAANLLDYTNDEEWLNETELQMSSMQDYYSTLIQWQGDSVALASLDTAQISSLEQLANRRHDFGGIEALNILNFFYGYNYYFDVPEDDFEGAGERRSEKQKVNYSITRITAMPNPAGNYSTVSWIPFGIGTGNATLRLYNAAGIEVMSTTVDAKSGQYVLNTAKFENGVYLIQLQTTDRILQTKLHVQH